MDEEMTEETGTEVTYSFEDGDTVISFNGKDYYLSQVLHIPSLDEDIIEAMTNNPEQYMFWSIVAAECEGNERYLKEQIGLEDALLDDIIRQKWAEDHPDGTRCTDTYVKAQTTKHKRHIRAVNAHIEADIIASIVKSFVRAFEQRHLLLLSLNANAREESRQISLIR